MIKHKPRTLRVEHVQFHVNKPDEFTANIGKAVNAFEAEGFACDVQILRAAVGVHGTMAVIFAWKSRPTVAEAVGQE